MKKHLLLSGLILLALTAITPVALAADVNPDTPASDVFIVIDGQSAELHVPLFVQNSTTYVSIRDFSASMGAGDYTQDNDTATVTTPNLTITASAGNIFLEANGRYLFVPETCRQQNGNIMVPVRVLAKAFDASILWEGETRTICVTKGSGAITPSSSFYGDKDLYWMSRIISAEARGEPLAGKIAVGSVIMNRLASPEFPKTVYDVIFDQQYGVQFTPAYSGAIYNTPSEECIIAAKIALDGGNTAGSSLYFAATPYCWAGRNRPMAMTIGNHFFYA